jgi:hypothetical protein
VTDLLTRASGPVERRARHVYLSYGGKEQSRRNESVNPCRACGTLSSSRFNRICTYALSAHKLGESFDIVSDSGRPRCNKESNSVSVRSVFHPGAGGI